MKNPMFNRMTENVKLEAKVKYLFPPPLNGKESTHAGFKNGKTAIFNSDHKGDYDSSNNWHFKEKPEKTTKGYYFTELIRKEDGWDYSNVMWFS